MISAIAWGGLPKKIFAAATAELVILYTSPKLIEELRDVIYRPHIVKALARHGTDPHASNAMRSCTTPAALLGDHSAVLGQPQPSGFAAIRRLKNNFDSAYIASKYTVFHFEHQRSIVLSVPVREPATSGTISTGGRAQTLPMSALPVLANRLAVSRDELFGCEAKQLFVAQMIETLIAHAAADPNASTASKWSQKELMP